MFQRPARPGRVRRLHVSHVVHDLVLALAGLVGAREDDGRRVGPAVERVRGALVREPRAERGAQRVHELRARRDAVGIKRVRVVGHGLARGDQLRVELLALLRGPEAPRPLLVHLRARRDAVDREVDGLRGPDDLADFVRKRKDAHELLALARDDEFRVVAVRAHVDDAVHVQVQVVDVRAALGGQAVAHALHDARVLVRQPPEHLRNAVERRDARRRRAKQWRGDRPRRHGGSHAGSASRRSFRDIARRSRVAAGPRPRGDGSRRSEATAGALEARRSTSRPPLIIMALSLVTLARLERAARLVRL
mmetsp:Transcript_14273/g.44155  ORF Transcript_14273/g.44155 Transcript_14273/m.44155 type:complete len:307 (+) Transcript_14273:1138-2058(+)